MVVLAMAIAASAWIGRVTCVSRADSVSCFAATPLPSNKRETHPTTARMLGQSRQCRVQIDDIYSVSARESGAHLNQCRFWPASR
jgi:hypothetical protein